MIILTKKKFCFELDGEQFTSRGGMEMENAPSWIQKTWLFDLAVKDGDIIVAQDSDTKTDEDEDAESNDEVEPESEVKPKTTRRTKSK